MNLESQIQTTPNGQEHKELLVHKYTKDRHMLIGYAKQSIRFEMDSLYKLIEMHRYRIITFPKFETDIFPLQKDERDKIEAIQVIQEFVSHNDISKKAIKTLHIPHIMKSYPSYKGKEQEIKRELIKAQKEWDVLQETEGSLTDKFNNLYNQRMTLENEQDTMDMERLLEFIRILDSNNIQKEKQNKKIKIKSH